MMPRCLHAILPGWFLHSHRPAGLAVVQTAVMQMTMMIVLDRRVRLQGFFTLFVVFFVMTEYAEQVVVDGS